MRNQHLPPKAHATTVVSPPVFGHPAWTPSGPPPSIHSTAQSSATIKSVPRPVQPAPAAATQYPPITLGSGPKAQVYVNKGRGYIDSKTGKPMPPSIVKAMGI